MLLTIRSLTKTFPGTKALDQVDFDLAAGEIHALLGENGAGKSTLIKCLTGAYARDSGDIALDGAAISPASTSEAQDLGIGTVYQEVNLLPNLTVAQNLTFGREPTRFGMVNARAQKRMAEEMLQGYGLDIDVSRDLAAYSVAIRQIVAIARAVYFGAKVLILDEPTSALGVRQTSNVLATIDRVRKQGVGVVFITHNVRHAMAVGDRFTVLNRGKTLGTARRGDITGNELQDLMAGGQEMAALEGSLGGTV